MVDNPLSSSGHLLPLLVLWSQRKLKRDRVFWTLVFPLSLLAVNLTHTASCSHEVTTALQSFLFTITLLSAYDNNELEWHPIFIWKVFYWVQVKTLSVFHTKLTYKCLYGPCFVHWQQSCWNRKGQPQTLPTKSIKLYKISWYAETLRVPFTRTKGPGPAPEKTIPLMYKL